MASVIDTMRNLDSMMKLEDVPSSPDSKYTVLVYFVTDEEVVKATDVHAGVIVMGTFANKAMAKDMATKIIVSTDYRNIMVIKTCQWHMLKPDGKRDDIIVEPDNRNFVLETQAKINAELDIAENKSRSASMEDAVKHHQNIQDPRCIENYKYRLEQIKHLKEEMVRYSSRLEELTADTEEQLENNPDWIG